MRKFRGTKIGKRILSAALAAGMVLAMLPAASLGHAAQAEPYRAKLQNYTSNGKAVVRGVLDEITELPHYGKENWKTLPVGTASRPFTVLEVVPYEEFSEFGYLIGGCEPLDISRLQGDGEAINYVNAFQASEQRQVVDADLFFFTDEQEGKRDYYPGVSESDWQSMCFQDASMGLRYHGTVRGFYEVVPMGQGAFKIETDLSGKKEIVKVGDFPSEKAQANIVWHSLHSNVNGHGDITAELGFSQTLANTDFEEVGDRLYTTRISTDDDYVINARYRYYSYVNKEVFLRDTVGLSKEGADAYSAVVKVITPADLNQNLEWIEYADLIYLSPKDHGGEKYDKWTMYNHLGHTASATHDKMTGFVNNDLSYNAVMKILDKNTAESNYAALLIDNSIYDSLINEQTKKGADFQAYDLNLDPLQVRRNGKLENHTYHYDGVNNNIYKLLIMVIGQNPNIVQQIYREYLYVASGKENDPSAKIKLKLQSGDAETYWCDYVFQAVDKELFGEYNEEKGGYKNVYEYLTDSDNADFLWRSYNYSPNFHTSRAYVQNRAYTFNGDTSIAQQFRNGQTGAKMPPYYDFNDYVQTDEETIRIWLENGHTGDMTSETAPPSAALRYILGLGNVPNPSYGGKLRVLDVEPAIGLKSDYTPDWKIRPSYIRMLVPNFTGTVEITHMTMSEFVGKIEDINSLYDLVYLGSDSEAFWKKDNGDTDFRDDSMDGWLYFHIGDLSRAGHELYGRVYDANFISGVDDQMVRFPGNDITRTKINDLCSYMEAGFPVVADSLLFKSQKMDGGSRIWDFVNRYKQGNSSNVYEGTSAVFGVGQADMIEECVRKNMVDVQFVSMPTKYDESSYLPTRGGMAIMNFQFRVGEENKYSYKIYVDQNRNGKFESGEVVRADVARGMNNVDYSISTNIVGLVQWRIEVFQTDRPNVRDSREGCCAIKCSTPEQKKEIKVLQIMPDDGADNADLTGSAYRSLYESLDAFTVSVDKITWDQFEKYFEGFNFTYDMGSEITVNNPNSLILNQVESPTMPDGTPKEVGAGQNLNDYNMFVIGFRDAYGGKDMSNANGAAEYLYYFAMSGRSILFTHDNTSLYNTAPGSGYTANAFLRDILGMNRYGVNSTELSRAKAGDGRGFRSGLAASLSNYRQNRIASGLWYDSTDKAQKQGFSLNSIRRIGQYQNNGAGERLQYKYLVIDAADPTQLIGSDPDGYDNLLPLTDRAVRMNVGQITEYPYNISGTLPIAATHSQWYQLNMEDPEVTVWYALGKDVNTWGGGRSYAASPNDAANNYYIYSKGNIFYSGVGHSDTQDGSNVMERKLFINTLIAAYRATAEPPVVEVTNEDVSVVSTYNYKLRIPREFNYDESGAPSIEDFGETYVKVWFRPMDVSFANKIRCRIYTTGETPDGSNTIHTIFTASGVEMTSSGPSGDFFIDNLENAQTYYFLYPKSSLGTSKRFTFEAQNDKINKTGFSYLEIVPQPIFKLD